MDKFAALGPFQYIGITIIGVLLTIILLFLLLREQKNIKASDGTLFASEEACKAYEDLCNKINVLYLDTSNKNPSELFDIQTDFIKLLTSEGFKDVKTLIKYQEDFKKLAGLFN